MPTATTNVRGIELIVSNDALDDARIPKTFWEKGVDDYYGHPSALKQVETYINALTDVRPVPSTGLFFRGEPVSGKTFLMTLALRSLMAKDCPVAYFRHEEVTDTHLGQDRFNVQAYRTLFVGIDNVNEREHKGYKNSLFRWVRYRVDEGLPMFIATNLVKKDKVDYFQQHFGDELFELINNNCVTVKCSVDAFEMQKHFDERKKPFVHAVKG